LSFPKTLVYVEEGGNSNSLLNNLVELFKILKKHTNFIIAFIGITLRYFFKIISKISYNSKKDEFYFKSILLKIKNEK
tara:strand:- start:169 stop:402 length:234 start_codon:yes stop_codon:yes gene_type:complete